MESVALLSMETLHSNLNAPIHQSSVLTGAPLLAKIGAGVAAVAAAASLLAWPDPVAVAASFVGVLTAWRLVQLAVTIEGDEIVVRNLFVTQRFALETAVITYATSDLRTRTAWGGHFLPKGSITKMADDNMQTDAKLIRIFDSADETHSTHIDCSLGLLPATQAALFETINDAL